MNASEARYHAIALRPAESPTLGLRPARHTTELLPRARGTLPPTAHSALDDRLLAILDAPLRATETPTQGFDRKERELGNLFFSHALYRRLVVNFACDLVARKFAGLADYRKQRLLVSLGTHCG